MKKTCYILSLAVFLSAAALVPGPALADIFMKQKHHTGSVTMMGQTQPARDSIQSVWITPDVMRNDSKEASVIIRLDKKTMTMIDHGTRTYTEMPMDMGKAMEQAGGGKMSREEKEAMAGMMKGMMKFSMTVSDTGEKKKIGSWNCRKYIQKMDMAMGPSRTELWATEDIKVKDDLFARYSAIMMTMQPGLRESMDQVLKETKKIKGVMVQSDTSTTMMGTTVKSSVKLLEFKEGKAPADITAIPKGYRKQSMH